jgi:dsDNA-specific endonuclease/ATPase MutS2
MKTFKKGTQVSVLDEDLSGIVVAATGTTVTIETEDGFILKFSPSELVASHTTLISDTIFNGTSVAKIVAEKETAKRKPTKRVKPKARAQFALEVDLHVDKLVRTTKGMTNFDMLNLQLDIAKHKIDFAIAKRIKRVVLIHGVGEGVLKAELETLLRRYDNIKFYEANYQKYGMGATEVYILSS